MQRQNQIQLNRIYLHLNFSGGGGGGGMPGGGCSKAKEDSSSHGKEESKAEPMIPLSCLEALKGE